MIFGVTDPAIEKMTKIEQTDFENVAKFQAAIEALLQGKEVFKSYKDKEGQTQKKVLIKNNRLYIGNNYSISATTDDKTGKVYLAVEYFGVEDRIRLSLHKKEESPLTV